MTTGTVVFHGEIYTGDDLEIYFYFGAHEKCVFFLLDFKLSVCVKEITL